MNSLNSATLDFNEADGIVMLSVNNAKVFLNPSLKLFLGKSKAERFDNTVNLKFDQKELANNYKKLVKILTDIDCEILETGTFAKEVSEIKAKESAFEEFSKKTLAVWKRELIPAELKEFELVVGQTIHRKLTKLQFLSALHLALAQNACNFSVPGAGKTTIIYSAYSYLKSLPKDNVKHLDRLLVIGPLASFIAWESEFQKCFNREPKIARITAGISESERKNILSGINPYYRDLDLVHVSFQTATNYEQDLNDFLLHPTLKTMLVIDEAHNIKREDGIWAEACIRLSAAANARVILTGTPAPNGYEDLSNLFKFLYPERNLIGFPRANLISMSQGKMSSESMRAKIRPFFTRITKKDLNLPPATENIIPINLSEKESLIYSFIEDAIVPDLSRDEEDDMQLFQRANMIRLRQAASNCSMLQRPIEDEIFNGLNNEIINTLVDSPIYASIKDFNFADDSEKYKYLKELCLTRIKKGQKILVWSYFISTLDNLEKNLKHDLGNSVPVWRISGTTPSDSKNETSDELTREKIIKFFTTDETPQILVANPQAIGESVSLHTLCHVAVYFDRDFNCGRFVQSKDRIHRYGLPPDVLTEYFYLTYKNTIDEDVANRLTIKEKRMNDLLERDEIPLFQEMSDGSGEVDDVVAIIKSYAARKLL
jgi:SNF2 family DNA or RNA helicase